MELEVTLQSLGEGLARICAECWDVERINGDLNAARLLCGKLEREKVEAHHGFMQELTMLRHRIFAFERRGMVDVTCTDEDLIFYEPLLALDHEHKELVKEIIMYKVRQELARNAGGSDDTAKLMERLRSQEGEIKDLKEKLADAMYELEHMRKELDSEKKPRDKPPPRERPPPAEVPKAAPLGEPQPQTCQRCEARDRADAQAAAAAAAALAAQAAGDDAAAAAAAASAAAAAAAADALARAEAEGRRKALEAVEKYKKGQVLKAKLANAKADRAPTESLQKQIAELGCDNGIFFTTLGIVTDPLPNTPAPKAEPTPKKVEKAAAEEPPKPPPAPKATSTPHLGRPRRPRGELPPNDALGDMEKLLKEITNHMTRVREADGTMDMADVEDVEDIVAVLMGRLLDFRKFTSKALSNERLIDALKEEIADLKKKLAQAEVAIQELQQKLEDMKQQLQDAGLGDLADKIFEATGLAGVLKGKAKGLRVFDRLYVDAMERAKGGINGPSPELLRIIEANKDDPELVESLTSIHVHRLRWQQQAASAHGRSSLPGDISEHLASMKEVERPEPKTRWRSLVNTITDARREELASKEFPLPAFYDGTSSRPVTSPHGQGNRFRSVVMQAREQLLCIAPGVNITTFGHVGSEEEPEPHHHLATPAISPKHTTFTPRRQSVTLLHPEVSLSQVHTPAEQVQAAASPQGTLLPHSSPAPRPGTSAGHGVPEGRPMSPIAPDPKPVLVSREGTVSEKVELGSNAGRVKLGTVLFGAFPTDSSGWSTELPMRAVPVLANNIKMAPSLSFRPSTSAGAIHNELPRLQHKGQGLLQHGLIVAPTFSAKTASSLQHPGSNAQRPKGGGKASARALDMSASAPALIGLGADLPSLEKSRRGEVLVPGTASGRRPLRIGF